MSTVEFWIFELLSKITCMFEPEPYVIRVRNANLNGETYLPQLYGDYGPRPLIDVDRKGRWSLGWRPKK